MFNTFYHKLVTTYVINRFFQIKNLIIASAIARRTVRSPPAQRRLPIATARRRSAVAARCGIRLQAKQDEKTALASFTEYMLIF